MTTGTSLGEIAAGAAEQFEIAKRTSDEEEYVRLKDGAPEWLKDAVHEAHGDLLPDDWRYSMAREAFQTIAEAVDTDGIESIENEFADNTDVYTADLLKWLASNLTRIGYCDEANNEYGFQKDTTTEEIIRRGQAGERLEVFGAIRRAIEAEQAEREADDDSPASD